MRIPVGGRWTCTMNEWATSYTDGGRWRRMMWPLQTRHIRRTTCEMAIQTVTTTGCTQTRRQRDRQTDGDRWRRCAQGQRFHCMILFTPLWRRLLWRTLPSWWPPRVDNDIANTIRQISVETRRYGSMTRTIAAKIIHCLPWSKKYYPRKLCTEIRP